MKKIFVISMFLLFVAIFFAGKAIKENKEQAAFEAKLYQVANKLCEEMENKTGFIWHYAGKFKSDDNCFFVNSDSFLYYSEKEFEDTYTLLYSTAYSHHLDYFSGKPLVVYFYDYKPSDLIAILSPCKGYWMDGTLDSWEFSMPSYYEAVSD